MKKVLSRRKKELSLALESFYEAHRLIMQKGLWKYLIFFALFSFALFVAYVYYLWAGSGYLLHLILNIPSVQHFYEEHKWAQWSYWILNISIRVFVLYFLTMIYKYILLILGSPFYAYLSEKTDEAITGKSYPFSLPQLIKDVIRGVRIALKNLWKQSLFTLLFLVLSFIPVVGWVASYFILRKDWYYYGFSMLDYNCERHRMNVKESYDFISRHNLLATLNGMFFYLLLLIPLLGPLLAPAYSSVAGTIAFLKMKEHNDQS